MDMNKDERIRFLSEIIRSDRLTASDLGRDGGVLTDIDHNQMLSLNHTGMYLVKMLEDHLVTRETLITQLSKDFGIEVGEASADIDEFLEILADFLRTKP
jgi:sensor domain CHASE-containing protein